MQSFSFHGDHPTNGLVGGLITIVVGILLVLRKRRKAARRGGRDHEPESAWPTKKQEIRSEFNSSPAPWDYATTPATSGPAPPYSSRGADDDVRFHFTRPQPARWASGGSVRDADGADERAGRIALVHRSLIRDWDSMDAYTAAITAPPGESVPHQVPWTVGPGQPPPEAPWDRKNWVPSDRRDALAAAGSRQGRSRQGSLGSMSDASRRGTPGSRKAAGPRVDRGTARSPGPINTSTAQAKPVAMWLGQEWEMQHGPRSPSLTRARQPRGSYTETDSVASSANSRDKRAYDWRDDRSVTTTSSRSGLPRNPRDVGSSGSVTSRSAVDRPRDRSESSSSRRGGERMARSPSSRSVRRKADDQSVRRRMARDRDTRLTGTSESSTFSGASSGYS